jgi:hypothetical protein
MHITTHVQITMWIVTHLQPPKDGQLDPHDLPVGIRPPLLVELQALQIHNCAFSAAEASNTTMGTRAGSELQSFGPQMRASQSLNPSSTWMQSSRRWINPQSGAPRARPALPPQLAAAAPASLQCHVLRLGSALLKFFRASSLSA